MSNDLGNPFKVRLSAAVTTTVQERRSNSVVFDVAPEFAENRTVNYKTYDPVHAPGQIYVYQNTSARAFQLSGCKLISRTPAEASINLAKLWTLRSWTMPNFGRGPSIKNGDDGKAVADAQTHFPKENAPDIRELIRSMSSAGRPSFKGAPPQVLLLNAYSSPNSIGHIRNIPCVITQLSIPLPTECDYIPTAEKNPTPMPTILTVDIQLTETFSPTEYEQFDLESFKQGKLPGQ